MGIIGVVAAMTMPTLIANHQKKEVVTKLKRIYSVMNQAINLSVAEYGDVKNWAADCGYSGNITCSMDEAKEWFNKYIGKHLKIIKIEDSQTVDNAFNVYLNDGSILLVRAYMYDMDFYTNKNAINNTKPSRNYFRFRFNPVLNPEQDEEANIYTRKSTFEPYAANWNGTREDLLNPAGWNEFGCGKQVGGYCSKLIQYDGWQIKDDYPW